MKALAGRFRERVAIPGLILLASIVPYMLPVLATRAVLPRQREMGIVLVILSLALAGAVLWQLRVYVLLALIASYKTWRKSRNPAVRPAG